MGEVEAKPARGHQRPGLSGVLAQDLAHGVVQNMRRRMRPRRRLAKARVDLRVDLLALSYLPPLNVAMMDDRPPRAGASVGDANQAARGSDGPDVADLSAPLRVEGRPVQNEPDVLP